MTAKFNVVFGFFITVGVILFVAGIAMLCSMPTIMRAIQQKINRSLPLKNGTESYTNWLDPPVPVYMQFWVFNVTNADDVVKKGAKPVVEEVGPYSYREIRPRENVTFLNGSHLISYTQPKTYEFDKDMSVGSENDTFISVNLPVLTVATLLQHRSIFVQDIVKLLLVVAGEHLFEPYRVKDFLWGYEEKTLKKINDALGWELFKNDKFGLFYGPGAASGTYIINSGVGDLDDINVIDEWNGQRSLTFWETEYCNMINGTDGTMWHPDLKISDTLYLFSSDICRSIYAKFKDNVTVEGIDLMHFVPPPEVFADHLKNPDNAGFCTPNCLGSGVLNVSRCKGGAPIVISQPHFYQGDPKYIDAITGMHPSSQHQTFIDVEPMTGVAMKVAKKLQINSHIKKLQSFRDTYKIDPVNGTIFPIVWLNESATITQSSAKHFKTEIYLPIKIIRALRYVLTGVGAAVILALVIALVVKITKERANLKYNVMVNDDVAGDT